MPSLLDNLSAQRIEKIDKRKGGGTFEKSQNHFGRVYTVYIYMVFWNILPKTYFTLNIVSDI